jgi:uncharacterized membrane protein
MSKQKALKAILGISVAGILFSGYLSYQEVFLSSCKVGFIKCGADKSLTGGIPACVLGLIMYILVFIISLLGYKSNK